MPGHNGLVGLPQAILRWAGPGSALFSTGARLLQGLVVSNQGQCSQALQSARHRSKGLGYDVESRVAWDSCYFLRLRTCHIYTQYWLYRRNTSSTTPSAILSYLHIPSNFSQVSRNFFPPSSIPFVPSSNTTSSIFCDPSQSWYRRPFPHHPSVTLMRSNSWPTLTTNLLYLVMGHPLVMGQYFHFVKSNKTYNNSLTIPLEKLIFE